MIGKLGSGKRTLAAQVAIQIAKKDPTFKIKIVTERDTIPGNLESMHSLILVLHDPVKTWYTGTYIEEIIIILLRLYKVAQNNNNFYIIAVFHCDDWNSLQFGKKKETVETMFPQREHICGNKMSIKLTEMAIDNQKDVSNVQFQKGKKSTGESFEMTLFLKNLLSQQDVLNNPVKLILKALGTLEKSNENLKRLAFKVMVIAMLHGGEIKKEELLADDIPNHEVFADLKEEMDVKGSIIGCTEHLLKIFLEKTEDGQSYRILHDIITRCTFIVAFKNHRTLLFSECDPQVVFECLRLKSLGERVLASGEVFYDYSNLQIRIPTNFFEEMARLFLRRKEMRSVLHHSRIYEEKKFQNEWNKAVLHFTNEVHVTNETHN